MALIVSSWGHMSPRDNRVVVHVGHRDPETSIWYCQCGTMMEMATEIEALAGRQRMCRRCAAKSGVDGEATLV